MYIDFLNSCSEHSTSTFLHRSYITLKKPHKRRILSENFWHCQTLLESLTNVMKLNEHGYGWKLVIAIKDEFKIKRGYNFLAMHAIKNRNLENNI